VIPAPYRLPAICCSLFLFGALPLLSSCTPTATGPSTALKQQFAQMQQQQEQQAEEINRLQQQIEQLLGQPSGSLPTSELTPAATTQPVTIPAAISEEISALADSASSYLAAFSNLAVARYPAAENGFANFINEYPEHQYSTNARYWLANAQFSQGKLQQASSNLRQVVIDPNGQERAPAALVLLAKIYQQQQMLSEADEVLEQLRSRYPESSEAQQFFQVTELEQQL